MHRSRVGVGSDSTQGAGANLDSVDDTNTERKSDCAHGIDLFSAVHEWTLRGVDEWRVCGFQPVAAWPKASFGTRKLMADPPILRKTHFFNACARARLWARSSEPLGKLNCHPILSGACLKLEA